MRHQRVMVLATAGMMAAMLALPVAMSARADQGQDPGSTVRAAIPQARPASAQMPKPAEAMPSERAPTPSRLRSQSEVDDVANVKVEVTISYQVGSAAPVKRTGVLVVADQGTGSLRLGNQVAVPSTTYQPVAAGGAATNPMTSFNYRSVGLNLDVRNVYISGNKTKMNLSVEFSTIDEKMGDLAKGLPSFPTFSQGLTLVLESGKPTIVAQSSDFVDNIERKQSVEVKATIVR